MGTIHIFPTASDAVLYPARTLSSAYQSRREYMALEIQALARTTCQPRVLCLGLAGLRDLEPVLPAIEEAGGEIVVLERNGDRAAIAREHQSANLDVVDGNLNPAEYGRFHLIYAPDLLNKLPDATAKRALARLAPLLKRGGKIVLTNLCPEVADSTYPIEGAYLRSEEQMACLSDCVADACITGQVLWQDRTHLFTFMEIHR